MKAEEEKIETSVAHVVPGKCSKSLWIFGELVGAQWEPERRSRKEDKGNDRDSQ